MEDANRKGKEKETQSGQKETLQARRGLQHEVQAMAGAMELKLYPTVAYATQQAMYADFCQVPANSAVPKTWSLRHDRQSPLVCAAIGCQNTFWLLRDATLPPDALSEVRR